MNAYETGGDFLEGGEESFLLVYLCLFGSILYFLWLRRDRANYGQISSVGFSGTLTSFITAFKCLHKPARILKKAYAQSSSGIFRYPTLSRWIVVVAKSKYIEELRKAPEDELSASEAMSEILQLSYTINSGLLANPELKSLLGSQLARNLHQVLPAMHSEMTNFVDELIPSEDDEWKYIDEAEVLTRVCNRIINQALVGTSLCRNSEFTDLSIILTRNLERYGRYLSFLPKVLRPFFAFLFTPLPRIKRRLRDMLANALKERQEMLVERGDSFPNDMITWFVSYDTKSEMPIDELVGHILLVNYLAVYPMVKVMIQAFRNLARHPDSAKILRLEVEKIVRQDGWSKVAIDKMHRLDSFLKETLRLDADTSNPSYPYLTMARKALRSITFSNGTTVPRNTLLFVGSQLLHTDDRHYPQPEVFNPFRFASPDDETRSSQKFSSFNSSLPSSSEASRTLSKGSSNTTMLISSVPVSMTLPATSSTFVAWGHGKHACPGRFFASSVMKLVLAHFVLNFDFRLPTLYNEDGEKERKRDGHKEEKVLWIEVQRRQRKSTSS